MKLILSLMLVSVVCLAGNLQLGKPLALKETTSIADIVDNPAPYIGKSVQVKGKITEVCQNMGCWMQLVDSASGKAVRIKVKDGEIVFPKDAAGKMAIAEGKLGKIELTKEQAIARAKHEAEEMGRTFDPSSIKSGTVIYQIQGSGAVVLE